MTTLNGILSTFNDPNNLDQMVKLHRLTNVFDAKKDAFHATTKIDKGIPSGNLYYAITSMVGTDMYNRFGTDSDLKSLEDYVLPSLDKIKAGSASAFSTTLGEAPTPISMLKSNVQLIVPIIPAEIVNAIVDAAADPKQYNNNITIVETPSQFSDPGTRPLPGLYYPRDGPPITIILSNYGFAPNSTFTARFNHTDDPITATIEIVLNGTTITVTIDRNGKYNSIIINGVVYDYAAIQAFAGNPTKNAFINGMNNQKPLDVLFAIVYVLCKEIGDTIQVLMLIDLLVGELNTSNTLIFTPDIVFAMRCRIVYIPCLLKKMVANSVYRSLLHYTGKVNEQQQLIAINTCYKNQCITQNTGIIMLIDRLIIIGQFSLGGSDITLTERGKAYLQTIIEAIGAANSRINDFPVTMDKTEFRLKCSENIAFNLFGKSGPNNVFKPNMSIKQLFPTKDEHNLSFGAGFAYQLKAYNDGLRGGSVTKKYKGGGFYFEDLHADFYDLCYPYLLFLGANYVDTDIFNFLRKYPSLQDAEFFFNDRLNELVYETNVKDAFENPNYTDNRDIITQQVYSDIEAYITRDKLEKIFNIKTSTKSLRQSLHLKLQSLFSRGRSTERYARVERNRSRSRSRDRIFPGDSSDSDAFNQSEVSDAEVSDAEVSDAEGVGNRWFTMPKPRPYDTLRRSRPTWPGGSRKINKSKMITTRRNKNKYSIKTSKHQKRRTSPKTQRRRN